MRINWAKTLGAVWSVALAIMVLGCAVNLARGGRSPLGFAVIILTLGVLIFLRTRSLDRQRVWDAGEGIGDMPELLRQLPSADQARIAHLAASGNAIAAIRLTRALLHVGLRTAKEAVDQLPSPRRRVGRWFN